MDEFLKWCRSCGMQFDGIEIRKAGEDAGYGVFAKQYFRPEEKLIVIPEEYMLTAGKVADMPQYSTIAEKAVSRLTPFEMLTIFFAMENPEDSEWSAYLKILPENFDTPDYLGLNFTSDDVPYSSRDHLIKHQAEIQQNMAKLTSVLPHIPRQKLLWAWHIVNTRCVYNENRHHPKLDNSEGDTLIIAPLIDMLNHGSVSQCVFLADKFKHNFVVKANSTVIEGDQALVTYGAHSNARLWYCYGFRLDNNIYNKIAIPNDLLFQLARDIGLNITQENENAIYAGNFPNTIYATDDSLSFQFLTNIKILLMSREEAIKFRKQALINYDYDALPETTLRIRIYKTAVRMLNRLEEKMTIDKKHSASVVHWIWDEDISLLQEISESARSELIRIEKDETKGDSV